MSEMEARHKKEIKTLEGEKRAALKKAKGTKGKKAKEALATLEKEFEDKLKTIKEKHQQELAAASGADDGDAAAPATATDGAPETKDAEDQPAEEKASDGADDGMTEKERKQAKAREKKARKKQREAERQAEIEAETANAGPGLKQIEEERIQAILTPLSMRIVDVTADGHCLYRAIAAQTGKSFSEIRSICADTLASNQDEFAPFCEYTDAIPDYDQYVATVRSTAEWGGHIELRALGMALNRSIVVYSAEAGNKPLVIDPPPLDNAAASADGTEPIRLSYHMHYYALGEHYNQVVMAGPSS
mmetsp:Transcript_14704/g.41620  ORF Transcript_14704/g.41620 Transcript_14704/m.41620 type:complete len:303 (-) Transcript_14704:164-1072(-)